MSHVKLNEEFLKELESEVKATRKCLERIPAELFEYKPHERSMKMGYLALIVAEIPRWISIIIEKLEIDFATFSHFEPKSTSELVDQFDKNMEEVRKSLKNVKEETLERTFYLKNNGQELAKDSVKNSISSSINHLVHHRGQLTVYMRLNNIPVPSIYGPSADDKRF